MSGPGQVWQQAADNLNRHLQAVTDDQWEAATPCEGWTVRDLVDHAVHWQAVGGSVIGAGTTPGDEWEKVYAALGEAVKDPSNFEGALEGGPFKGMEKHQVFGLVVADALIHSWDLARAIGADETLPGEAVEGVLLGLERMPDQMLRSETMFGPAVEVPADASQQDKMLALAGRQP